MGDEFLNMDYTDNNEAGEAQPATATLAPAENGIGGPPRAAEADGNGEATDMDRARMPNGQEASPQEKEKVTRPSHDFRKCEVGGGFITVLWRGARVTIYRFFAAVSSRKARLSIQLASLQKYIEHHGLTAKPDSSTAELASLVSQ
jgi:hypothetical protein